MISKASQLTRLDTVDRQTLGNHKTSILLSVMAINFLLTGVDVVMAHSENGYFRWELIPLIYAPIAVASVLARVLLQSRTVMRRAFDAVMWLGVVVGFAGTFLHLVGNATSSPMSFDRLLVTGSPIAAPIAFAGIAGFALASDHCRGCVRRSTLLRLVGLGFFGAVLAAFFDHARLGFLPSYTLIPLVTGGLATVACFYMVRADAPSQAETNIFLSVLLLNLMTGLIGFGLHLLGDLAGTQDIVWARLLYRAPLLGPLLFSNMALLGGLSILPEPPGATDDRLHQVPSTLVH